MHQKLYTNSTNTNTLFYPQYEVKPEVRLSWRYNICSLDKGIFSKSLFTSVQSLLALVKLRIT